MSERRSPTIRRRRLGAELRRRREHAGVTIEVVAQQLECSTSKVSRIETGHTTVTPRDVRDMLQIYGTSEAESDELVQFAREARQKGWWHPYSHVLSGAYVGLEDAARTIRTYEQQVVSGLLQTQEYADAMLRLARPDLSEEEVKQKVRVRMARQSLLTQDDPVNLSVVLDEAVVSRPVGGDAVMRGQLQRLVEVAQWPNVTLQLLPFEAGAHAGMDGTFTILSFHEPGDPGVVYAENATGGLFLEKSDELDKYHSIFEQIRAAAVGPEESIAHIVTLAEEPLWKWRPRGSPRT
ncbi:MULTISPECIES: helix-turn-helix domain-containing protein [Micromonospora]|uniref:Helix-turn-helix domain-containing protein n=1 Tax=Micromonospora yangpuensis TaxID=683228 RepID=A0A1C6TX86_9ACTN|nr:helix-turn-helix transcriptional regulator [Micromonospora yangpuensis]GGM01700.1 transcriptional regulator [Micromonospora yangpuensis]SCL46299.1 Helix-turn-helix domain-containing protein [Micromonospora yangpuensis]